MLQDAREEIIKEVSDSIKLQITNDLKVQIKNELKLDYNSKISDLKEENEKIKKQSQSDKSKHDKEINSLKSQIDKLEAKISVLETAPAQCGASASTTDCPVERPASHSSTGGVAPRAPSPSDHVTTGTSSPTDTVPEPSSAISDESRQSSPPPSQNHTSHPPSGFRIPKTATKIIIGDSNLKHIDRKRLDPSGKTHVRSIGGLTAVKITDKLSNTQPKADVTTVIIHVGTNDIDSGSAPTQLVEDITAMCATVKSTFPSAKIHLSGILPQKGVRTNDIIDFNYRLKTLSETKNFSFLWNVGDFLAREGFPSHLFAKDKYHLNARGLGVLLRGFKLVIRNDGNLDSRATNVPQQSNSSVARRPMGGDSEPRAPGRRAPERRAQHPPDIGQSTQPNRPQAETQGGLSSIPPQIGVGQYPPLPERRQCNPAQRQTDPPTTLRDTPSPPHTTGVETVPSDVSRATQSSGPFPLPPLSRSIAPYVHRPANAQMMMRGYYPNYPGAFPYTHFPFHPAHFMQPSPFQHMGLI